MVTMQDIADEVGVSKAAVSRILNDKGSFSQETIRKVKRAAHRLGYISANALQQERTKSSRLLAVVTPPSVSPYYGILTSLIEQFAYEYNYDILLAGSLFNKGSEDEFFDALHSRKVDGAIMVTFVREPSLITSQDMPVVTLGFACSDTIPSVRSNNLAAGQLAARHLVGRGCSKLLYATHFPDGLKYDERWDGFKNETRRLGCETWAYAPGLHDGTQSEKGALTQMFLEHPDAQGAFSESYRLTVRIYQAAQELGYQVPKDLRIIGHGTPFLSAYSGIDLTVIQEDTREIAQQAVSMLIDLIEGNAGPTNGVAPEVLVPVSLHVGHTS